MGNKEIITRIKNQLEDGYIDFNDTNDNEEMNYIRVAIHKLTLYEKALDLACEDIHYYEKEISNCYDTSQSVYTKEEWKEYLLKEVQDGK